MIATLILAAALFAAQIAAYILIRRALHKRATFKRRTSVLYVAPYVRRTPVPHAHNRPGEN